MPGRIRTEVLELCGHGYQAGSDPPGNIGKEENRHDGIKGLQSGRQFLKADRVEL